GRRHDLDPPRLAATAGVDLRLHHDGAAERSRHVGRFGGRAGDAALQHGDAVLRKNLLGLELVDVHAARIRSIAETSSSTWLTETLNSFCSLAVSASSMTRSTPPPPINTGTPT